MTWPQAVLLIAMRAFLFGDEWLWIRYSFRLWHEAGLPAWLALGIFLPAGAIAIYVIGYRMQWKMERLFGAAK